MSQPFERIGRSSDSPLIDRLSPATMHRNAAFSQAVTVAPGAALVFVGGQNGVRADGTLAGNDLAAQAEQATRNVGLALDATGCGWDDLVRVGILLVLGEDPRIALSAWQAVAGPHHAAPVVGVAFVAGLANPVFRIEIEAIAARPAELAT